MRRVRRFAPLAAIVAFGAGCGPGVMCGGPTPEFSKLPLQFGKRVSVGPPTESTSVFYPVAVPGADVATVVEMTIEDDRPDGDARDQCMTLRAVGKQGVLWYCQRNTKWEQDSFFDDRKSVEMPGKLKGFMLPCEDTRLVWNKDNLGYDVFGDPAYYTPDEVERIGFEIAREDLDPAVPKVGRVVTSMAAGTAVPAG